MARRFADPVKAVLAALLALGLEGFTATHSVGDVAAHLRDYAGQTLTVHGVLNKCTLDSCSLCPDWEHVGTEGCLDIRGWQDDPDGDAMARLYRYAELDVTATIFNNGFDGISDCFSEPRFCYGHLLIVRVDRLIERRPAPLVHDAGERYILPPDAQTEAALRAAFNTALGRVRHDPIDTANGRERLFQLDSGTGYLCFRQELESDAKRGDIDSMMWPLKGSDFLFSYGNPYRCMPAMRKKDGDPWVVSATVTAYGVEPIEVR